MQSGNKDYSVVIRNFNFGVEDSLVSTVGLLTGIALAGASSQAIILTGFVLVFVEAFSMGVGSLLSERYVQDYKEDLPISSRMPVTGGIIMFASYVLTGLIPLAPYFLFSPEKAVIVSVIISLLSLFILGFVNAKLFGSNAIKEGFLALALGGVAVAIGIAVGQLVSVF